MMLLPAAVLAQTVNPLEADPRASRAGAALFRAQCATCHGADARGIENIEAPDLSSLWALGNSTDQSVFESIRNGIPGSIMPPHGFPDTEIWMLVSYLKSLDNAMTASSYDGDPVKGQSLFTENCQECHRVNGTGGSLGPDLSRVTALRSKETLINSIRNPSNVLVNRFKPVTLTTRDNRRIRGTLKSEDAFSIQIMDSEQNLKGFMKADLLRLDYDNQSLMPEFGNSALSEDDLNDILAYLESQRRNN